MSGLAWLAYIAAGVVADLWRDHKHDRTTLSDNVRIVIRAFPHGAAIFTALCIAVPVWFHRHITRRL